MLDNFKTKGFVARAVLYKTSAQNLKNFKAIFCNKSPLPTLFKICIMNIPKVMQKDNPYIIVLKFNAVSQTKWFCKTLQRETEIFWTCISQILQERAGVL